MISKDRMPLAVGIAFVAFTTQFGGGFASGAQLYQYFINYGLWGVFMPILAQLLLSLFFWYGLRYAFRNRTYDYRSFSNHFYGKLSPVFSNLYEIVYLMLIFLAPAVAFATGGSTLNTLTGIPYWLCTLVIGIFIFSSPCSVPLSSENVHPHFQSSSLSDFSWCLSRISSHSGTVSVTHSVSWPRDSSCRVQRKRQLRQRSVERRRVCTVPAGIHRADVPARGTLSRRSR